MAQFTQTKIGCTWLVNSLFLLIGLSHFTQAQTTKSRLYLNQSMSFVNYSLEQGLSNKRITAIHQDREGFIWVGTMDGLNRFDGHTFTVFRADSIGISYAAITYIHEGPAGMLWLSTLNRGLLRFDKRSGIFTSYRLPSPHENERNTCLSVFEDKQGKLWISSRGGLNKFDPKTSRFTLYPNPAPGEFMYALHQDQAGIIWCATDKGLFQFDPSSSTFTLFPLGVEQEHKALSIHALYSDRAGNLWIGTEGSGLFHLNPLSGQITSYPYQKNGLTGFLIRKEAIMEDASGKIWVGTDAGLHRLDPATGQFTAYRANSGIFTGLKSNAIWSLYLDQLGLIWVGTTEGLHSLMTPSKPFHTYQFRLDPSFSHRNENAIGFLAEGPTGNLWLNNDSLGGLYRYDWANRKLAYYSANPSDSHSLWDKYVPAVYEDHKGVLWVLSGNYLHKRNPFSGKFIRYPTPFYAYLLAEDHAGNIWVGGVGLARFDQQSKQFFSYHHIPADSHSLPKNRLSSLFIGRSGTIWMGVHVVGLSKLEPKTGRFTHYRPDFNHTSGHLNDRNVIDLYEDDAGLLWIATGFGGLNRLNPNTGIFTSYTTRNGLPSNTVKGILGDDTGYLWLSTDHGISRFDPTTQSFRNYDHKDGLQEGEFHNGVKAKRGNGELLFGGPNGFNVFDPDSIRDNPLIPPVYITAFKVLEKARLLEKNSIELTYKENFLSFDFVALNYIQPEKNKYAYQLIGVDKDWVYSANRRFVSYTDLDPGSYTFRVKASNNDGVWNQKGTSMQFVILPPFYRTWWFITISILTGIGLLYGAFRYRIHQIRTQERDKTEFNKRVFQLEMQALELEMQALRAQMNPHFIFNCLNSINRFILKNQPKVASDYLSKFSRLIRLILQNSNTPTVTLESELDALTLYLEMEMVRFEGKFTFSIVCGKGLEVDFIEIPPLIIQPYVENAIWHGLMHKEGAGHITIKIEQQAENIVCIIEDDGIGRNRAAELKSKSATKSKSLGMQITAHRLELLHTLYGKQTRVEVVDLIEACGQACGTRVILSLPIGE
ncbi:hypothetical protein GXP67_30985 [Rhodocytophaga rosea]|uniref:Histidine kinase n=1 Tax=Rhodocytophaga rosea TaxID=2704465 RepID=A0A6C0GTH8_9BACT|nr:sensor histidine kinase [Rhodocytophaga rosea]QHT70760.1 hypothetical protein GXP67_30985 [Rhodocytophaga rosea]